MKGMAFASIAAAAFVALPVAAEICAAKSGGQTVPLIELYTSEGCSSCPPADRWLSTTVPAGGAPANAIALAFHVDYWDRLGWKDRFASASWTERQYAMARANHSRLVYTPQVMVQGHDFPDWHGKAGAGALNVIAARSARARIAVEAEVQRSTIAVKATGSVPAGGDRKNTALFIALTDSRLVSEVKAGENAGVRLTHDHVVRALSGGTGVSAGGEVATTVVLPIPAESGSATTVVAFVQNTETGDVLQALALPIAPNACSAVR
ncbi:MAG: DUF1223 domain-containing protein [Betaproteobacteria bacterium]